MLAFSWSCPPPGPLFWIVLGRAFLALCLVFGLFLGSSLAVAPLCRFFLFVFRPVVLRLSSLRPLCAAFGVAGLPCLAVFVVLCGGSPPPLAVVSLPPFGCSLAASWSSYCAGPSLWVSGCFIRRPGCLALMLGVLWCFASSLHLASWQQRPLALCGVLCYPLHHGACVVVVICAPALRSSS